MATGRGGDGDGPDGADGGGGGRPVVAPSGLSASVEVGVPPERVFALWADAARWPDWDPDLEAATLDGPFAVGSRGTIEPRGAPRTRIRLVAVEPPVAFTAEARLPLCRLRFEHRAEPLGDGRCRVTHAVRFDGALAPLFAPLLGRSIRRGLPGTLAGLRRAAEAGTDPAGTAQG